MEIPFSPPAAGLDDILSVTGEYTGGSEEHHRRRNLGTFLNGKYNMIQGRVGPQKKA